ncbi:MAG: hypothetical protein BGO49_19650 [Planctomycetales bacterium 71-10]|nr:MAG: hypothetical protein BGO49_19650 [Planctomycetales bacterium 71-10]
MILNVCGTWAIEWGPGSPRPDHFMLYRCGDHDEYVDTFLTLRAAIREATRWEGSPALMRSIRVRKGLAGWSPC